MVHLDGGSFLMGSDSAETFPSDGEGPVRTITLSPLYVASTAVTNEQFAEFVHARRYVTDAERIGSSFVFHAHSIEKNLPSPLGTPWWVEVVGASWAQPEGLGSSIAARPDFPVVHVSWNDALAYCHWAGVRLPTEAEWEYAARGGLVQKSFPWGDQLTPNGQHMCNIWQGTFPHADFGEDGFTAVAPADSYKPNRFGLFNMVGNTWEWCADFFDKTWHIGAHAFDPAGAPSGLHRVLKGGSFLCHESYCNRYRVSARTGNTQDTSSAHIGFRVVRDV